MVARLRCLKDGPRAPMIVLSFGNNHLSPVRAGLLPLLVGQTIRIDPTVLDEHDLQECKWLLGVHTILIAVAGEELLTRFDGASCYYPDFPMNDFEATVFLSLRTSFVYSCSRAIVHPIMWVS
jgi:hypothetical protein